MVKIINFIVLLTAANAFSFAPQNALVNRISTRQHSLSRGSATPLAMSTADSSSAVVVAQADVPAAKNTLLSKIWNEDTKIGFYLFVWYVGNIGYNIYNKKACNALGKDLLGHANAHWALSAFQLFVGVLFVVPLW